MRNWQVRQRSSRLSAQFRSVWTVWSYRRSDVCSLIQQYLIKTCLTCSRVFTAFFIFTRDKKRRVERFCFRSFEYSIPSFISNKFLVMDRLLNRCQWLSNSKRPSPVVSQSMWDTSHQDLERVTLSLLHIFRDWSTIMFTDVSSSQPEAKWLKHKHTRDNIAVTDTQTNVGWSDGFENKISPFIMMFGDRCLDH